MIYIADHEGGIHSPPHNFKLGWMFYAQNIRMVIMVFVLVLVYLIKILYTVATNVIHNYAGNIL